MSIRAKVAWDIIFRLSYFLRHNMGVVIDVRAMMRCSSGWGVGACDSNETCKVATPFADHTKRYPSADRVIPWMGKNRYRYVPGSTNSRPGRDGISRAEFPEVRGILQLKPHVFMNRYYPCCRICPSIVIYNSTELLNCSWPHVATLAACLRY